MHYFKSARIRLTLWYIAIVTIVCLSFSAIIYHNVTSEIEASFQSAEIRLRTQRDTMLPKKLALYLLNRDLEKAKNSVKIRLIIIDGIIIAASGIAAYFLARRTLRPLEEMVEEQKRFTADASHELKTPLTALRTELEVALRSKSLTLKEARKLLKSNLEEVEDLQNLSENLMKLNRYSQAYNGVKLENLNLKEIIDEAVKKVSPMAKKKSIQLIKEVNEMNIKADKQSLIELLVILLDNAIKYSPEKSTVTVISELKKRKVILTVKDTGTGIAKADIPHLFDRFYRADMSRNKTQADPTSPKGYEGAGGYGLGLAIAKEIVERHKGEIGVESKVGKGSIFKVVLPL